VKHKLHEYIDLREIANSGQCFRWRDAGDGKYLVIAGNKFTYMQVYEKDGEYFLDIDCNKNEFESFWKEYLDLNTSYTEIQDRIMKKDKFLKLAADNRAGIRILNQGAWEMLITFIISQRKNIPAITSCVEALCKLCGDKIGEDNNGDVIYAFPTPVQIAGLSMDELNSCSLGYRSKYIKRAAEDVLSGTINLDEIKKLDDDKLHERLCEIYGVGIKVANCVVLFGYHRLNAFPIDVWIERVLAEHYPDGFPFKRYAPYCGVMQQYLFSYYRDIHK